jgi:hypothetical protein
VEAEREKQNLRRKELRKMRDSGVTPLKSRLPRKLQ